MRKVPEKDDARSSRKGRIDPRSSRFLAVALPTIYVVALAIFCLVYGIIPGPEFLVLCLFIYAAYNHWSRRFVKDWVPFVLIFLSYETMYGIVGTIAQYNLHAGPHNLEIALFGSIPSLILQQLYRLPILDYIGAFFYSLHFFAPTLFGFFLWRMSPKNYWKYTIALAICSYGALVTYLCYPVAPPWIAVPGVSQILTTSVDKNLGFPLFKTTRDLFSSDLYAAFPSLHSAFPWLISLFAIKVRKTKALPILVFPFGVWFSAVYLGEHYVVDVIGGIAYATLSFIVAVKIIPYIQPRFENILKKHKSKPKTEQQASNEAALEV
jgi:membrane-associated phospholipid phosphatase